MMAQSDFAGRFGVLDHAPVGMCVIDKHLTVLFWNNCLADWTRIPKSDIMGQQLGERFGHFNEPRYKSRLLTIFDGGAPAIFSSQLHKHIFPSPLPNGEMRIQHTTVSGIPADGGKGFHALFAVEDVTELTRQIKNYREMRNQALDEVAQRKKAEDGLRRANRRILDQQKAVIEEERLKVLLQMAGARAHELNQPLMSLLGNIQLMNLEKQSSEKLEQRLTRIEEAGERIAEIVKKIQTIRNEEQEPLIREPGGLPLDRDVDILSIEDSELEFKALKGMLRIQKKIKLHNAKSIKSALEAMEKKQFDLVFLDYFLPDGTGIDFISAMSKSGLDTPVVVITGKGDEVIASQIIQAGAYGYIPKSNLNRDSLLRIIPGTLEKARLKREMKMARDRLAEMSIRDELTSLYNRRYFTETLERELSSAKRYGHSLSLCLLDLDKFKSVNDTYGHMCGDSVLKEFSKILRNSSRNSDIPSRFGGEEFAVIMPNIDVQNASAFYERVRGQLANQSFTHKNSHFHVTVSAGVASFDPSRHESIEDIIAETDQALYRAKNEGRDRVVVSCDIIPIDAKH